MMFYPIINNLTCVWIYCSTWSWCNFHVCFFAFGIQKASCHVWNFGALSCALPWYWHLLSGLWCLCHYCCHSYMLCICYAQLLLHSLCSCNGHESLDPIILGVLHLVIMHACVWCMLKIFCALWAALHCAFTVCASCQRLWLLCYGGLISHLAIWACYTTRHNVLTSSDFTSNIFTTLLVSLLVVTSKWGPFFTVYSFYWCMGLTSVSPVFRSFLF